jgi:hypothetical protein
MKIALLTLLTLITTSCVYASHPQNRRDTRNRHQRIELHHSQVATPNTHFAYIEGHYNRGQWVQGQWREVAGIDPNARRNGWYKIRGQWVGHGSNRRWINPHWENSRDCRHSTR